MWHGVALLSFKFKVRFPLAGFEEIEALRLDAATMDDLDLGLVLTPTRLCLVQGCYVQR